MNESDESPRYRNARAELKRDQLNRHPEHQAEAIARHYLSLASVSEHLLEILKARSHLHVPDVVGAELIRATNETIALFVQQVKDAHLRDFGLPLEWPSEQRGRGLHSWGQRED